MSRDTRKADFGFRTRPDTNRPLQPQRMDRSLKFHIEEEEKLHYGVEKTKTLISCAIIAQLICIFVFAYAKIRFCHDVVHIDVLLNHTILD